MVDSVGGGGTLAVTGNGERRLGGFRVVAPIKDGKGSQGAVYRAVCERATVPGVAVGEVVALKTMTVREDGGEQFAKFEKRTRLLSEIDHPNVVRYKGCFAENGPFNSIHVLVMVIVPELWMPPPQYCASQSTMVPPVRLRVPLFKIPPPLFARPPVIFPDPFGLVSTMSSSPSFSM